MPTPTPIQPQQHALLASTPSQSAIVLQQQNNQNHNALVNATKGGLKKSSKKYHRYYNKKGGMTDSERSSISGQMVVPIVKPIYVDQGAGNQTVNSISTNIQALSTQNQANAQYDSDIGSTKPQSGGKRRKTNKKRTHKKGTHNKRKTKRTKNRRTHKKNSKKTKKQ
jgi:hypothetical protein